MHLTCAGKSADNFNALHCSRAHSTASLKAYWHNSQRWRCQQPSRPELDKRRARANALQPTHAPSHGQQPRAAWAWGAEGACHFLYGHSICTSPLMHPPDSRAVRHCRPSLSQSAACTAPESSVPPAGVQRIGQHVRRERQRPGRHGRHPSFAVRVPPQLLDPFSLCAHAAVRRHTHSLALRTDMLYALPLMAECKGMH